VDAVIGHAAAQRTLHALPDLRVGWTRVLVQERLRSEDLPVLAESALRHLLVDPCLLNRMELTVLREPLERRDLGAGDRRHRAHTRADGFTFDQHRARAALAEAASEPRAHEAEIIAQHV
jgi:hypothetical protein